ncbi:hypothetical protein GCM10009558_012020 [Virgisporangium aurantiacum]
MRRLSTPVTAIAGTVSAVLAIGRAGAIVILAAFLAFAMIVGALCWVVADAKRPARLAMLVRTYRTSALLGSADPGKSTRSKSPRRGVNRAPVETPTRQRRGP